MKKIINRAVYIFLVLTACDHEEMKPIYTPLTFDDIELLCEVLPVGGYFFTKVRFTSQNNVYLISATGRIFKSEDGGNTWVQQESGTEMHLYDMFFLNDTHGYVVGGNDINEGIVLKTIDGGNIWSAMHFDSRFHSVYFLNDTTGFLAGRKLLKTQDGGQTWYEIQLGYFSYGSIDFFDNYTGFLTAGNTLLKTTDGGINWFSLSNVDAAGKIQILNDLAFIKNDSRIYKTSDKGNTWKIINTPASGPVHFINGCQGVGVGQYWYDQGYLPDGILYITNDGGKHWEGKHYSANEFYNINDINFLNDSTALAVGTSPNGCIIKLRF